MEQIKVFINNVDSLESKINDFIKKLGNKYTITRVTQSESCSQYTHYVTVCIFYDEIYDVKEMQESIFSEFDKFENKS